MKQEGETMQEVEFTCAVTPEVRLRVMEKLARQEPQDIVVNEDRYYDTETSTLYEQAVFVRVRTRRQTLATSAQLQCKFDEPKSEKQHILCIERAFDLSHDLLPDSAHAVFRRYLPEWVRAPTW